MHYHELAHNQARKFLLHLEIKKIIDHLNLCHIVRIFLESEWLRNIDYYPKGVHFVPLPVSQDFLQVQLVGFSKAPPLFLHNLKIFWHNFNSAEFNLI